VSFAGCSSIASILLERHEVGKIVYGCIEEADTGRGSWGERVALVGVIHGLQLAMTSSSYGGYRGTETRVGRSERKLELTMMLRWMILDEALLSCRLVLAITYLADMTYCV
jgi:hypothetical protein